MQLRTTVAALVAAIVLGGCGSTSVAQNAPRNQRQLEATACKQIRAISIPPPNSGSFVMISVPSSTLLALQKTDNASLKAVVHAYKEAANAEDNVAMIRALNHGVKVCHALGLKTAT